MNAHLPKSVHIGLVVKAWREYRGLKPTKLAEASGVSRAYVSLLERRQIQQPGSQQLNRLAQVLGVPLVDLVNHKMPPVFESAFESQLKISDSPLISASSSKSHSEAVGERIHQMLTNASLSELEKQQIGEQIIDLTQNIVQMMTTARKLQHPSTNPLQEKHRILT